MHVRMIEVETEYEAFTPWWERRGLTAPSKIILMGAHGLAVRDGAHRDICAGWVYVSNKGIVGMVEWVVSNPDVLDGRVVKMALGLLYDFLEQFCKDTAGCTVIFTSTQRHGSVARFLEKRDWKLCSGEPHAHFAKGLS